MCRHVSAKIGKRAFVSMSTGDVFLLLGCAALFLVATFDR